jgi:hypothetical protein
MKSNLIVPKYTILKMEFGHFQAFPIFPLIGDGDYLFNEFFLISLDGAAKTQVFEDFINDFDLRVMAIEEFKCLLGFRLGGLISLKFELGKTL